jgi:hypothetical protein
MNIYSNDRKRKLVAFLATGMLLAMLVLASVEAPRTARAGGPGPGIANSSAVASPTPQPHLLWQYDVVVAINPAPCAGQNGLFFYGNGGNFINGGGALSYGCVSSQDMPGVFVEPPYKIRYAGGFVPGGAAWDPYPEYARNLIHLHIPDLTAQAQEACEQFPKYTAVTAGRYTEEVIPPGNYSSIHVSGDLTMLPGLYCLGGEFWVNSGARLTGDGVTIFISVGEFYANENSEVHLTAPPEGVIPDPLWLDLLLLVPSFNHRPVIMGGNSLSNYHGVVFSPGSTINISSDADYHTQLIGWNVEIGGVADVTLSVDFWPEMPSPDWR